jgi:hypothetical protein
MLDELINMSNVKKITHLDDARWPTSSLFLHLSSSFPFDPGESFTLIDFWFIYDYQLMIRSSLWNRIELWACLKTWHIFYVDLLISFIAQEMWELHVC